MSPAGIKTFDVESEIPKRGWQGRNQKGMFGRNRVNKPVVRGSPASFPQSSEMAKSVC